MRRASGFTLVELMIVVVIIGIIAAIAIPNYIASENRAREAGVKANMHAFQLASEDFRVKSDSTYAGDAADIAPMIQGAFRNPFDRTSGSNNAWEDRAIFAAPPTERPGITSYADSSFGLSYNIKGFGRNNALSLVLTSGR